MKLYFKKLGVMILIVVITNLVYTVSSSILITVANGIFKNEICKIIFIVSLFIAGISFFVYRKRINDNANKRAYLDIMKEKKYSIKYDILNIINGKDWITELYALVTVLIPTLLLISLMKNEYDFLTNLINAIIAIVFYILIFIIANTLIWISIHRKWTKERVHAN